MREGTVVEIPVGCLRRHERNSNVMKEELLKKLAGHIGRTGRYPPLIVREMPREAGAYQVLDGHHRWKVLERLGHATARVMVWEVDDAEALVLLTTLNRLQGQDDPRKRAAILDEIEKGLGGRVRELARIVPETVEQAAKLLRLRREEPVVRPPRELKDLPVAVHFFVTGAEREEIEARLKELGGTREAALLRLIRGD